MAGLFSGALKIEQADSIVLKNPRHPGRRGKKVPYGGWEAYLPDPLPVEDGFELIGGVPIRKDSSGPVVPDISVFRRFNIAFPWDRFDWRRWEILVPRTGCSAVPAKTSPVAIPVQALTRMIRVSGDCARVYALSNLGSGCVVNVITETVDATFTVTPNPNPNPPYPPGITPIVHPFTKGGINHKYKRLYVPASFYGTGRSMAESGFYVAIVDVDPTSGTYLQTTGWINCGWIPEEISFTSDNETGVIANYMQGTATIFKASDHSILAQEVDGFDGAGADPNGGPWSRSVRCADIPGLGNRAFLTLSGSTPKPGLAVIDLDDPAFGRSNIEFTGGALGVAVTPDQRRVLTVTGNEMRVIKVDATPPVVERTIALPTSSGQSYWSGIAVRPSGDLAFVATGSANSSSPTQGTQLAQVNYMTGTVLDLPSGIAPQTWNVEISSLGSNAKPHIFVGSLSGTVTIIPC